MRIVITGPTFSGKTSLVEALGVKGYCTVPESAIQIVNERISEVGLKQHSEEKQKDRAGFFRAIAQRQLELECKIGKGGLFFLDRGYNDYLAFLELFNLEIPKEMEDTAKKHRYNLVFFCELLPNFKMRKETGRIITKGMTQRMGRILLRIYAEHGYEPVIIKETETEKRIKFIENYLKERGIIS